VPVGLPVVTTSRLGTGAGPGSGSFFATQVTSPTPTLGVQFVDAWNQSWTMTPISSATQLRRLRALYQFATGTLPRRGTGELTLEEAERQFLCDYPLQAHPVSPGSSNLSLRIDGCLNNNTSASKAHVVHADPTFMQGPACVICIDDLNAKQMRPHINPNLKYHFMRTQRSAGMVHVGSYGASQFYVCESDAQAADPSCIRYDDQAQNFLISLRTGGKCKTFSSK